MKSKKQIKNTNTFDLQELKRVGSLFLGFVNIFFFDIFYFFNLSN